MYMAMKVTRCMTVKIVRAATMSGQFTGPEWTVQPTPVQVLTQLRGGEDILTVNLELNIYITPLDPTTSCKFFYKMNNGQPYKHCFAFIWSARYCEFASETFYEFYLYLLLVSHNFMAAADSAIILLELDVQWDQAATHS